MAACQRSAFTLTPDTIAPEMANPAELEGLTGTAARFGAFVAERHPFALAVALEAFEAACGGRGPRGEAELEAVRPVLALELTRRLEKPPLPSGLPETTPGTTPGARLATAHKVLLGECDGFLRREAIESSLTREER